MTQTHNLVPPVATFDKCKVSRASPHSASSPLFWLFPSKHVATQSATAKRTDHRFLSTNRADKFTGARVKSPGRSVVSLYRVVTSTDWNGQLADEGGQFLNRLVLSTNRISEFAGRWFDLVEGVFEVGEDIFEAPDRFLEPLDAVTHFENHPSNSA